VAPFFYIIYSSNQPTFNKTLAADYVEDKAIQASHNDPINAVKNVQTHLNEVSS